MYFITDFNYEASKEFIDFYMINTIFMTTVCNPQIFNGLVPIQGTGGLVGLVILI